MALLLRSLQITDLQSRHHGLRRDLRISSDGRIAAIAERLEAHDGETVFEETDARISPGFVDVGAYLGDPGHEEREDYGSLTAAAAAGGYTTLAVLPESEPVRQSVADLSYLTARRRELGPVEVLPLAALSRQLAGKDLTEYLELARAGAVGFTDGPHHPVGTGLLRRALQYSEATGRRLFVPPHHPTLSVGGQMHEGSVSTRLGLPGIPTVAETIAVGTALELVDYIRHDLVLHPISAGETLRQLRTFVSRLPPADRRGKDWEPHCTVSAHHLTFTDDDLAGFDPNLKMLPPLRTGADRDALRRGVEEGRIAAIVSNHRACYREEKDKEFSYAAFGALGLQTTLRQLLPWIDDNDDRLAQVVRGLTSGPRRLLGLEPISIAIGEPAELTIFTTTGKQPFTVADLRGKTHNSPLLGHELPGRILAIIKHGRLWTSA